MQEGAKRQRGLTELVSLCGVPFVLSPEAKGRIFKVEAALQIHHQMHSFSVNVRSTSHPFTTLPRYSPTNLMEVSVLCFHPASALSSVHFILCLLFGWGASLLVVFKGTDMYRAASQTAIKCWLPQMHCARLIRSQSLKISMDISQIS